ncbi:MAG: hypothetical protein P4L53_20710 [Candidatus Obscuribacterales bacterium]|nr:hypothetical protein [Candidatus Obscuribacterales bacterium]
MEVWEETPDYFDAFQDGFRMTKAQKKSLMQQLKISPDDPYKHLQLLGYYSAHHKEETEQCLASKLWLVENLPEEQSISVFTSCFDFESDEYRQIGEAWLAQVRSKASFNVVSNAASFFTLYEKEVAVQVLKQALSSSSEDYSLLNQISDIYMLAGGHQSETDARENYLLALEYGERCYSNATSEEHRFYALTNIAQAALAANETKRAEDAANQLLASSKNFHDNWNFGNAVFDGNTILGKIRFIEGDIEAAGKYLIAASQTPGSPQLDSFGPDFRLCAMLIDKNQLQMAREFLINCSKFWKSSKIKKWITEIDAGIKPQVTTIRMPGKP